MSVRMPHVRLAHAPRHVGWRPGHFQSLFETVTMDAVDVVDPDRHPDAFVGRLIAIGTERRLRFALAAAALTALAKKDLGMTGTDAAENRRVAPVPAFFPSELF